MKFLPPQDLAMTKRAMPLLLSALLAGCVSKPLPPAPRPVFTVPAALMPPPLSAIKRPVPASILPPPPAKTNVLLSWDYPDGGNHLTAILFKPDLNAAWTPRTNVFGTNYQETISGDSGFYELADINGMVELAWDPSSSTNVVGYKLYWGGATGDYTNSASVGPVTNSVLADLSPGDVYFFAATAVDSLGRESRFSNEVTWTAPTNAPAPQDFLLQLQ